MQKVHAVDAVKSSRIYNGMLHSLDDSTPLELSKVEELTCTKTDDDLKWTESKEIRMNSRRFGLENLVDDMS